MQNAVMAIPETITRSFNHARERLKDGNPFSARTTLFSMLRFLEDEGLDADDYLTGQGTSLAAMHLAMAAGYHKNAQISSNSGRNGFDDNAFERIESSLDSAAKLLNSKGHTAHEKRAMAILKEVETSHLFALYEGQDSFKPHLCTLFNSELKRAGFDQNDIDLLQFEEATEHGKQAYDRTLG